MLYVLMRYYDVILDSIRSRFPVRLSHPEEVKQ